MAKQRIISLAFLLLVIASSCKKGTVYYEESGSVFHTFYSIKYQSDRQLTDKIDAEFEKFNLSLNPFNPNSIITKVNNNEPVELDEWFIEVFNKAQEVSERSGGAFDITCAPFVNLWGFGFANMDTVSQQVIDSLKEFTGYQKIRLENGKVIKDDPRIDLNEGIQHGADGTYGSSACAHNGSGRHALPVAPGCDRSRRWRRRTH